MQLNESEWKVMTVVWRQHPATVRDVLEALGGDTGWAYSTVKTLLGRLVDKGALSVRKRANTSLFEPLISRRDARQTAVQSLLERAFDGTFGSLVHHLIGDRELSGTERSEIRQLLAEAAEAASVETPKYEP